jgi:hypothetical protein
VPEPTGIEHVAVAADDVDTTVEKSDGYTAHPIEEL